jgi:hypothetical protein
MTFYYINNEKNLHENISGSDQAALKKDRTLTIIGIVIGVLVFVCICIASYVLAK